MESQARMADPPTVSSWKKRHDSKLARVHKDLAKRQVEYDLLKEENMALKAENATLKAENATLKANLAKALAEEEKEKTILSLLEGLQSHEFGDVVN